MKQSERIRLEADAQGSLAEAQQHEIDRRIGQVEKLQQEIVFYEEAKQRYLAEQTRLLEEADKENAKELDEEKRQKELRAAQMAQNIYDDTNG